MSKPNENASSISEQSYVLQGWFGSPQPVPVAKALSIFLLCHLYHADVALWSQDGCCTSSHHICIPSSKEGTEEQRVKSWRKPAVSDPFNKLNKLKNQTSISQIFFLFLIIFFVSCFIEWMFWLVLVAKKSGDVREGGKEKGRVKLRKYMAILLAR